MADILVCRNMLVKPDRVKCENSVNTNWRKVKVFTTDIIRIEAVAIYRNAPYIRVM